LGKHSAIVIETKTISLNKSVGLANLDIVPMMMSSTITLSSLLKAHLFCSLFTIHFSPIGQSLFEI
jgi:hypothetical protein